RRKEVTRGSAGALHGDQDGDGQDRPGLVSFPMITPNEQPWLRCIAEDPANRARWLIFADWLEESCDGRANLVRACNTGQEVLLLFITAGPCRRFCRVAESNDCWPYQIRGGEN